MTSPRDARVQWYANAKATESEEDQSIADVLQKIKDGAFRGIISKVRAEDDKDARREIKKHLPAFTPCGTFLGPRTLENMAGFSGFIMLDIDDVPMPETPHELRDRLATNPHACAAFISAGGAGVAVLMRLAVPVNLGGDPQAVRRFYAAAYQAASESIRLETDQACKNANRLRFVSDDPGLWVNWDAKPLVLPQDAPAPKPAATMMTPPITTWQAGAGASNDQETAARALSKLARHRADNYADWLAVGMALHAAGLPCQSWDDWSRGSAKWKDGDCARRWAGFNAGNGVGIGSLIHMAKQDDPLFMRPGYRPDGTPAQPRSSPSWDGMEGMDDGPPPTYEPPPEYDDGPPPEAGDGEELKILDTKDASQWVGEEIEEPDPLLPGLFERGDKVLLSGASKSRKSFFILQLAIAQASGKPFLRWQAVTPRRVLLVQLEVKECHYHARLKRLVESTGVEPADLGDRLKIVNGRGKVRNIAQITDTVDNMKPDLVIIDPLYKLMDDENDTEQVSEFLHALDRLAEKSGAAILYVHHHAKGNGGDRSARDRASGSGRFARDYDAAFDMTHHAEFDDTIVLSPDSRNHLSPEPFCIRWEGDRFIDAPETIAEVKTSESQKKKQSKEQPRKPQVADSEIMAMIKMLGPLMASDFEEKVRGLGATREDARTAKQRMISAGNLASMKAGIGGKSYMVGTPEQIKKELAQCS